MANREWEIVKSTVDKIVRDSMAAANMDPSVGVTEVDDSTAFEEVLKKDTACVVYRVNNLTGAPRGPKWTFTFQVGVKTTNDGANYQLAKLLADINGTFTEQARFPLHNYNDETNWEIQRGSMLLTQVDVTPQQFDKQAGIRLLSCRAMAVCSAG